MNFGLDYKTNHQDIMFNLTFKAGEDSLSMMRGGKSSNILLTAAIPER